MGGLTAGPFTAAELDGAYGHDNWRCSLRFGVWQRGKIRACDDAKRSGVNDATVRVENMVCEQADYPALVSRYFAELAFERDFGPPAMRVGTDDLADAYRHMPVEAPNMSVAAQWDPHSNELRYFTMAGFSFGLASAPNQFNRFPETMVAVARRLLGIACSHFYDDYCVCEAAASAL